MAQTVLNPKPKCVLYYAVSTKGDRETQKCTIQFLHIQIIEIIIQTNGKFSTWKSLMVKLLRSELHSLNLG